MPARKTNSGFLANEFTAILLGGAICCFALTTSVVSFADALDEEVAGDLFLATLGDALSAYEIDVAYNLNSRAVVGQRIQRPRLGRFPDLPLDSLATSEEISTWELSRRPHAGSAACPAHLPSEHRRDTGDSANLSFPCGGSR